MYIELLDKQIKKFNSDGYWKSDGYANIAPGATSEFRSCGSTGAHLIYYRIVGTNDEFPSQAEVDKTNK
jgi:hypothetical protein